MNANRQGIAIWLRKADNDWLNVQNNLASARIPWDTVCFHAQQTIEKMLKALLVHGGVVPPRVHDLLRLLDAIPAEPTAWAYWRADCQMLNDFAVLSRYDGADPKPAAARAIIKRAGLMRTAILDRIEEKPAAKTVATGSGEL